MYIHIPHLPTIFLVACSAALSQTHCCRGIYGLSRVSFCALALRLRLGVESIQYSSSIRCPFMRLRWQCACATFQFVYVAVENANATLMHAIPAVLRLVYGVSSLATLKRGCECLYSRCRHDVTCPILIK